jgi:peptidoglycan/xylan/chitin deacetylase (PgdA/CDA1 family)
VARKKQYQTRLDPDTADKVDTYAEQQDVTKAEALRRLVTHGLDHADEDAMTAAEIRDDLEEIRNRLDADDGTDGGTDDTGKGIFHYRQEGGYVERLAGGVMAIAMIAIATRALLGPTAATIIGVGALGVATYLATVFAVRNAV